jgi:hypothetical protein
MVVNNVLQFPDARVRKPPRSEPINNVSAKLLTGHTLELVDGRELVVHDQEGVSSESVVGMREERKLAF